MNLQPPGQRVERVPPDPKKVEEAFAEIERALQRLEHWETSSIYSQPADHIVLAIRTLAALVREYITYPEMVVRADPRVEAFGPVPREATTAQVPQTAVHDFRTGG